MNREALLKHMSAKVADWAQEKHLSLREKSALLRDMADGLWERLMADAPDTDHISAPNAVVEVVDADSGALYRRYLELGYDENDNGVRLVGEDMTGREVQAVFLSESALRRMHELRGAGPDVPRCGDEHGSGPSAT